MVKRFIDLFDRVSGLHEAAYLLGTFALLSQLLGFFRDRLLAAEFGAGSMLDIYYAAFRVPDFIFIWSASMVSLSVLIPFLSRKLETGKAEARAFLDTIFTGFFVLLLLVSVVAFLAAPLLSHVLFPGFGIEEEKLVTLLMRIMLLQPLLLGISNLFASVTQLERKFFVYAVSPILYNAGIIVGIAFLYSYMGPAGLAWGVVLGALLHLAIQVPIIVRSGLLPRFIIRVRLRELWEVMLVSLPRTFALSAQNLGILLLTALGSLLGAGSIAVFNLAWNLQSVPLSIVGASYSLAAFPTLSGLWVGGERAKFMETLFTAVRHILFWSFPALVLFIVLRAQIVRTVLGAGSFDWNDTRLTAASLALFATSVVAQSLILLFTRAFYAAGKTKVPVLVSLGGALASAVLALGLTELFARVPLTRYFIESLLRVDDLEGTLVLVLSLSYSLATIGSAIAFWIAFSRVVGAFDRRVFRTFWQSFASSIIMGAVSYGLLNALASVFDLHTTVGIFLQGLAAGIGGIVAGILILYVLGNQEVREISRTLHRKIWRAKFIGPDPTDASF